MDENRVTRHINQDSGTVFLRTLARVEVKVVKEKRITVGELATSISMSVSSVHIIFFNKTSKWARCSQMGTQDQKDTCPTCVRESLLEMVINYAFIPTTVTMHETHIHCLIWKPRASLSNGCTLIQHHRRNFAMLQIQRSDCNFLGCWCYRSHTLSS